MFGTNKSVMKEFDIGRSTLTKYKRFIERHPDRYGRCATTDHMVSRIALIDAMKYMSAIERGEDVPEFEPDAIRKLM